MSVLQVTRAMPHRQMPARSGSSVKTIRSRILFAFLVMTLITSVLGLYAAYDIRRAGGLVSKTFDKSLMAINYARAASADFNAIQAAFARQLLTSDHATRVMLDAKMTELEKSLNDDLSIAMERSQSDRASAAGAHVQRAVAAWSTMRGRLIEGTNPNEAWRSLDHFASVVEQQIDLLINYTAGDGFSYRQSAQAAVALDIRVNLLATLLAVVLSGLAAWLLARTILGPIAKASEIAKRIAGGHLDVIIPKGGDDEIGALLSAMEVMRENIRASIQSEVAQRRSAQSRLADALESSREGIIVIDADSKIVLANAQAGEFLAGILGRLKVGGSARDLMTTIWTRLGPPGARTVELPATRETRLPDGRWLRVSQNATQEGGVIIVFSDITVLKEQEAALTGTNQRFDVALANMSQGLCLYDADNRLQVFNRRFCEIFRLPSARIVVGMPLEEVIALSVAVGNYTTRADQRLSDVLTRIGHRQPATNILDLADDRVVALAHQPLHEGGWVETYEDVTERLQSEAKIVYMARHDALTGLPNRLMFAERAELALGASGRGDMFALLMLDLDHFKQVNDTLGHPIGDALLRVVAERLSACIREVDTVARLGGDEFAIVQSGLRSPDDATILARRIVDTMKMPFEIEGHRVTIGVSIGISMAPGDGTSYGKLLKNADVALYKAKADGRDTWRFFEMEMDARLQARRALELDLREALAEGWFELYYQPLFDFKRNEIGGFEALLRWNHPVRGMISPSEFIPIAEEIGLITQLGEWVLNQACREAQTWPEDIRIAVNVSPAQFRTGQLAGAVVGALAQSGLEPSRLDLEITESVILANTGSTMETLQTIRALGVKISMDDFGTGYSSLSYLRSFPFDKVKIDQSFIRDLDSKADSSVIVGAIIGLCKSLGMRVTAEGVESQAQLDFLFWEGCSEAQGYYFSRPVPAERVPALLVQWADGTTFVDRPEVRMLAD
ncbi:EAL domain-containing protein [Beijerinckia sp. L45]|uniref:EAL domain-containing protein n=1 Tax=Beijerinckia sp. L45 TaxID=1641855 RepID=UPI001FEF2940|nr:EAL domain-containing protein [Beijerinckia sp. L45]